MLAMIQPLLAEANHPPEPHYRMRQSRRVSEYEIG
jgi:hypothetical protein